MVPARPASGSAVPASPFPAFFDLRDRRCLLVGGGRAAAAKARLLLRAGARLTVVAPRLGQELRALAAEGALALRSRGFVAGDVIGCVLAIGAAGRAEIDERVAEAAAAHGVPVNIVDRPDLSSFAVPAIVDRAPVAVAISTGGTAPVLARRLRRQIEALLPARLGPLARFAERFRGAVAAVLPDLAGRRRFWERFFDGPVAARILAGDERGAREAMLALVNGRGAAAAATGSVALVGAGPGDPDLLTLRALRLLQEADIVVHDRLVAPAILDYARREAERIAVGKARGAHSLPQAEINRLLARHAAAGRRVVRLKGGDPFVFGRGGEEAAYLRAAGIAVEVVPGITAALGCAAATGIPLTHRDLAHAAVLVTGESREGEPDLDWAALARLRQTLVVYMGVAAAGRIAARLIEHGLDPATPAAIVENGTRPEQRTLRGRLADLGALVRAHAVAGPALLVIGDVVGLAEAVPQGAAAPLAAAG